MVTAPTHLDDTRHRILAPSQLRSVLDGAATFVHCHQAITESDCAAIVRACDDIGFENYAATDGLDESEPVSKLATTSTLFDYYDSPGGFAPYFEEARSQMAFMRRRFAVAAVPDPLQLMVDVLDAAWPGPVEVATEPGHGIYNAGVIRSIPSGALPHVDDAVNECPELEVGKVIAQGSILIYLTGAAAGGGVRVFHKSPSEDDRIHNRQDWGFAPRAIAGVPFTGVNPTAGDIVIFPTTLIHAVDPVTSGRRISASTFFGLTSDGRLILWS